jgi:hypothetical protein
MPVTITLNDELATRLHQQAQAQRLSLEQWALTVLGHATEHPQELQTWAALNQRRFALIRQRYTSGLSETDECELAALQATVAQMLEPWDRALSEKLAPYETLAAQLPSAND